MSRSGYSDDLDVLVLGRWRAQVASAIRGKRGQQFLKDLLAAMDAMPEKRLIKNSLHAEGDVCAIGSLGLIRGVDMSVLDPEDPEGIARVFGIAHQLVQEVEYWNDENGDCFEKGRDGKYRKIEETPEGRWARMRAWVSGHIKASTVPTPTPDNP